MAEWEFDVEQAAAHGPESSANMKICVIIASKGRPHELSQWTDLLNLQTVGPFQVIYSVTQEVDLPERTALFQPSTVVMGPAGLPHQRNRGLEVVEQGADVIAFFDDDYVPSRFCLEDISKFMEKNVDVSGANGCLLADGIKTPGVTFEESIALLAQYEASRSPLYEIEQDLVGLYGCNMVFRASAIQDIRFDEKLPLYAWQEDIDFAVRVNRNGRIVKTSCFVGVHQGTKSARVSGVDFGYAQIANPLYLIRKGTMPFMFGLKLALKNVLNNHIMMVNPEPWIDRRGRAAGNWIALRDIVLGKCAPGRILDLRRNLRRS
ncbi:glycosyltransferase family 2 protein [Methylobacterium sp. J-030]|uniref:glycosyltransferase family 2 protein n=1 Tax=Methylobacterium sp. J-030 TaxID=2836627 RepID=UPI001FB8CA57|nr:glycosyltransferase family 2 protein [Methylobacterium sp. J-030]MCJ2068600.1 glycosyltransferase family 2 protein [Methylobacterium sp. J-030]